MWSFDSLPQKPASLIERGAGQGPFGSSSFSFFLSHFFANQLRNPKMIDSMIIPHLRYVKGLSSTVLLHSTIDPV